MTRQSVHVIVNNVAEIMRQRDRDMIGQSLVRTFFELIPCREIDLYSLRSPCPAPIELSLSVHMDSSGMRTSFKEEAFDLPSAISDLVMLCLETKEIATVREARDKTSCAILPVFDEQDEVMELLCIHGGHDLADHQKTARGLLMIYRNYLALIDENQRDKLTGLLNRKTFDDKLMKIVEQADTKADRSLCFNGNRRVQDRNSTHWLAIFDIDHFKRINDTFGHLFGDEVLVLLARLMKNVFRSYDLLFRFGGEEFVVVLRTPSKEDAASALERFRKQVASYPFPQVGQVSISIGYTEIYSDEIPIVILGRADQALYFAKRAWPKQGL